MANRAATDGQCGIGRDGRDGGDGGSGIKRQHGVGHNLAFGG